MVDIPQDIIRRYEISSTAERRVILGNYRKSLEEQGLTKEEVKQALRDLRAFSGSQEVMTGSKFYKKLAELQIEDSNGASIGQRQIEEGIKGKRLKIRNPDMNIFEAAKKLLTSNLSTDNIESAMKKIKTAIKRQEDIETSRQRSKLIKIDKRRFLGANDLSYASKRQEIYDFWEQVSGKHRTVLTTLNKLIREAKKADMFSEVESKVDKKFKEDYAKAEEKERERLSREYKDDKKEIERKEAEYLEQLERIEKLSEKPLEYIVKSGKISSRFSKDPLDRILEGIARYESIERKLELRESEGKEKGEESTESQRAWEEAYLNEANTQSDDIFSGATADDASLAGDEDALVEDPSYVYSDKLLDSDADPLLAIEILGNKKLLGIEEESISDMQNILSQIRDGSSYINYISYLDKMAEELEESYVLEQDEYFLPIYTYQKLESILSNRKFTTATQNKTIVLGEDVKENLENLFEAIHFLFTDERFGFLNYPTDIGSTDPNVKRDARRIARDSPGSISRKKILRIFTQSARQSPQAPPKEGQLISGLDDSDVGVALGKFVKACSEYYFEPFTKGFVAGAYPRFLASEGAKAVTTIANKLGYNTIMGQFSESLTQIANVRITGGQMKSLADFLTTLDEPAIVVDDNLIRRGERAARVLTSIFGKEKENLNTVAAILMHYIEETDALSLAGEKLGDETIRARSKKFYQKRASGPLAYPIFALPYYLESNRNLFTRESSIKRQYERLISVLEDVEDDIPEVLTKLLKAHNEIRKALGRKVVYGMLAPTYNSYDRMIDYMHQVEGIDLSHLEVENIVKAVDSHTNIGKEYGITEEQVYLIKANFR